MLIYNCDSKDGTQATVCLNDDCVSVGRRHEGPADFVLSKPDAIDLGKRLLEHFDALPTADDVDSLEQYAIRCGWASATYREQSEIEATIAKLRRLVGEEE